MKVVVTGGAGFVGSHIVNAIEADDVFVIDRKVNLELAAVRPDHLGGVEAVIHAAAHADISRNWDGGQDQLYHDNIEAMYKFLSACAQVPTIRSFVFLSTCAVYGDTPSGVIKTEADQPSILSPYAATKLAGEAFVEAYAHKCGWHWNVARLVSCVGDKYTHGHIADFVKQVLDSGVIVAKDAGTAKKSFVHVEDAAEVITMMAREKVPSGIYNVTSKEQWGWPDTIRKMRDTSGSGDWRVERGEGARGWVGDPVGLCVSGQRLAPWFVAERPISEGVADALASLGWR